MVELNCMAAGIQYKAYINPALVRSVIDDASNPGLARIVFDESHRMFAVGSAREIAQKLSRS